MLKSETQIWNCNCILLLSILGLYSVAYVGSTQVPQGGHHDHNTYRVRSRRAFGDLNYEEEFFFYTHSRDAQTKNLDPFIIDLFQTPPQLSEVALETIRNAMNKFLLMEVGTVYKNDRNQLDVVQSEINSVADVFEYKNAGIFGYGTGSCDGTFVGCTQGSAITIDIALTFEEEPSPRRSHLENLVKDITTKSLKYFVGNLTTLGAGVDDLKLVTKASRRDDPYQYDAAELFSTPTPAPSASKDRFPVAAAVNVQSNNDHENNPRVFQGHVASRIVPSILAASTFFAVIILVIVRRRRRSGPTSPKPQDQEYAVDTADGSIYSYGSGGSFAESSLSQSSSGDSLDSRMDTLEDNPRCFPGLHARYYNQHHNPPSYNPASILSNVATGDRYATNSVAAGDTTVRVRNRR